MIEVISIGIVRNQFKESTDLDQIRNTISIINIKPGFEEGLHKIEEREALKIIYYFHLSGAYRLKGPRHDGEVRGVFNSRSPHRPSRIGISTVKLLERNGNSLKVIGLDALDRTPVLDIKPYDPDLDQPFENEKQ